MEGEVVTIRVVDETAVIDVCCWGYVRDEGVGLGDGRRKGQRVEGGSMVAGMCWCEFMIVVTGLTLIC